MPQAQDGASVNPVQMGYDMALRDVRTLFRAVMEQQQKGKQAKPDGKKAAADKRPEGDRQAESKDFTQRPMEARGEDQAESQEKVTAPRAWKSAPDHQTALLAYITPKEADVLRDKDLHGSGVDKKMHFGPGKVPSFQGDGGAGGGGSGSDSGGAASGDTGGYGAFGEGGGYSGDGMGGTGTGTGGTGTGTGGTGGTSPSGAPAAGTGIGNASDAATGGVSGTSASDVAAGGGGAPGGGYGGPGGPGGGYGTGDGVSYDFSDFTGGRGARATADVGKGFQGTFSDLTKGVFDENTALNTVLGVLGLAPTIGLGLTVTEGARALGLTETAEADGTVGSYSGVAGAQSGGSDTGQSGPTAHGDPSAGGDLPAAIQRIFARPGSQTIAGTAIAPSFGGANDINPAALSAVLGNVGGRPRPGPGLQFGRTTFV